MKKSYVLIFSVMLIISCKNEPNENAETTKTEAISAQEFLEPSFTLAEANKLIELPLHCVGTAYPYKPGETLESKADLVEPIAVHPIFYGCFDWHSAVHGY
jgi:PBP1b-binding outer membrane lipoprotein LpoB